MSTISKSFAAAVKFPILGAIEGGVLGAALGAVSTVTAFPIGALIWSEVLIQRSLEPAVLAYSLIMAGGGAIGVVSGAIQGIEYAWQSATSKESEKEKNPVTKTTERPDFSATQPTPP